MKKTIIKERLQSALIAILFISVFLPFGLTTFGWMRWVLIAGIGIIIAFCVLTSELIVDKLLRMPNEASLDSHYIIKRNICFESINILLSVVLMSLFLDTFANNDTVDNHFGWQTIGYVFIINCFTTIVIHIYWRSVYKKRYLIKQLGEAQLLNGVLLERHRHFTEQKPLTSSKAGGTSATLEQDQPCIQFAQPLTSSKAGGTSATLEQDQPCIQFVQPLTSSKAGGTSEISLQTPLATASTDDTIYISGATKESLNVRPSQVVYVSSEGNYVRVNYVVDGNLHNMLIRTSMKNVSDLVCNQSYIMQCHRAYIVNLRYVVKVENRSSGIALVMQYGDEIVLVSKQYSAEVKERIKNPSTVI